MIIECDRCYARYRYDETRFAGKASKKVRCTKCMAIFDIFSSEAPAGSVGVPAGSAGGPSGSSGGPAGSSENPAGQASAIPSAGGEDTVMRLDAENKSRATTEKRAAPLPPGRRTAAADLKLPADFKVSLAVIAGPESGRIFLIEKPRVIIGRQDADVSVDDPEVSRQHAAVEISGDNVVLLDLGSTNGTFVGEERISELSLENQSEFSIGGTTLMLIVTAKS